MNGSNRHPGARREQDRRRSQDAAQRPLAVAEALESRQLLAATVSIVKDINSGGGSSSPQALVDWSGQLAFATLNGPKSRLWATQGTDATTTLVGDISHLDVQQWQSKPTKPRVAGGKLFFTAWDPVTTDPVLWTSESPATAPHPVVSSGLTAVEYSGTSRRPVVLGNRLLFEGTTNGSDNEPWITDGTSAGTNRVFDVLPGLAGGGMDDPTVIGRTAYFLGYNGSSYSVWRTDGTAAGTFSVCPINYSSGWGMIDVLAAVDDQLFFVSNRRELWATDGTAAGTRLLKTFDLPSSGSNNGIYGELVAWNGKLYFGANETAAGLELWSSDGTVAGTKRVADINPGVNGSTPRKMTVVGDRLYFLAQTASAGYEWWSTDGTGNGTAMMADLVPGANGLTGSSTFFRMPTVVAAGGRFYFTQPLSGSASVTAIWQSDGTAAGTSLLPLPAGATLIDLEEVVISGTNLYFDGIASNWPGVGLPGSPGTGWEMFTYPLPVDTNLPSWVAPGSSATWNAAKKTLGVSGPLTITADPGADVTLTVAGPAASVTIAPNAAAAATVRLGALHIQNGGRVTLAAHAGGSAARTLVLGVNPSVDATGTLDLANNALVIKGGAAAASTVRSMIGRGFDAGAWLGTGGITSSAAAADPNGVTAVGFASNAILQKTSFAGVTGLSPTDVLVKYTYYGDADLSGHVTLDDFTLFLGGYQTAGSTNWLQGDLDFNGTTTLDDFTLFLSGLRGQGARL